MSTETKTNSSFWGTVMVVAGRAIIACGVYTFIALLLYNNHEAQKAGRGASLHIGVIPIMALAMLGSAGLWCVRYGKKMKILSAEALLQQDQRPPVVYLRSFAADGEEINTALRGGALSMYGLHLETPTDEEDLAKVLSEIGPFIAIGRPNEKLPELGASRLYVSHENWQSKVSDLVDKAGLIVLRAGMTEGLLWEIENVMKRSSPERVLLYLPYPPALKKPKKRKSTAAIDPYEPFRELVNQRLPHPLPKDRDLARFIKFDKAWVPEFVAPLTGFQNSTSTSISGSRAVGLRKELAPVFGQLGLKAKKSKWLGILSFGRALLTCFLYLAGFALYVICLGSFLEWYEGPKPEEPNPWDAKPLDSRRVFPDQRSGELLVDFTPISTTFPGLQESCGTWLEVGTTASGTQHPSAIVEG